MFFIAHGFKVVEVYCCSFLPVYHFLFQFAVWIDGLSTLLNKEVCVLWILRVGDELENENGASVTQIYQETNSLTKLETCYYEYYCGFR